MSGVVLTIGDMANAVSGWMSDAATVIPQLTDADAQPKTPMEILGAADFATSSIGLGATILKAWGDASSNAGLSNSMLVPSVVANASTISSGFAKCTDAYLRHDSEQFADGMLDMLAGAAGLAGLYKPFAAHATLLGSGAVYAKWLLKNNPGELGRFLDGMSRALDKLGWEIGREVNDFFKMALNWVAPKDPLVLDLDGDGIEATAIDPTRPILFDHDADGIKTATGWIKADDGIVVLDSDGNGTIDTGRELFGDNTLLADGTAASNGYQALARHDLNADGKINASDAIFGQLRIWQDANQDGVSQSGELRSLSQVGISSIGVVAAATKITLGNGNTQPWSGSFTRTNGSTGSSGTAELSGSLLLAANNFFRTFTDDPEVSTVASALPQVAGSGVVRDLRQAMSLGSAEAEELVAAVQAFAAAGTRDQQLGLLDTLITRWADTNTAMVEAIDRFGEPSPILMMGKTSADDIHRFAQAVPQLYMQYSNLERFNGTQLFEHLMVGVGPRHDAYGVGVVVSTEQREFLAKAWEYLVESVYAPLVQQTRLKTYLDSVNIDLTSGSLRFASAPLVAMLDERYAVDPRNALIDLAELNLYQAVPLATIGLDGLALLRQWLDALPSESPIRAELQAMRIHAASSRDGGHFSDVYLGDAANNSFAAGAENDALSAGAGNDLLQGGEGDDVLSGDVGNDTLMGGGTSGIYGSGAGGDVYVFRVGDGQDVIYDFDLTEGVQDAVVFFQGVVAADVRASRIADNLVLRYGPSTDQVTINEYFKNDGAGGWVIETIRFADGSMWQLEDMKAKVLIGLETNDQLTAFESADILVGNGGADVLHGRGGNDTLSGGEGVDQLQGGLGDDTLDGGPGNDVLSGEGHAGVPISGRGNDTYLFGRGDGQDTIHDVDATAGNTDRIVFKAGVLPPDVQVVRSGDHMILKIVGTTDQVMVSNQFQNDAGTGWVVEEVRFADDPATVWDLATLKVKALVGSAGNDTLTGYATNDTLAGNAGSDVLKGLGGNDTLSGDAGVDQLEGGLGDDTLDGGAGNDVLSGESHLGGVVNGRGNDTYLFGRGDGQDTIHDVDVTAGNVDRVVFKAGVLPRDVQVVRSASNMILKIIGTTDEVLVLNHFQNDGNTAWVIEEIRFTDDPSTVWDLAAMKVQALVGGMGNDTLTGFASNDALSGGAGVDQLQGGLGDDTLDGGAGNDVLSGESHLGGVINGRGNDTYLFGRGDGQDTIHDVDATVGNVDRIVFKAGVLPRDVQIVRSGDYMTLKIIGSTDQILVSNHFQSEGGSSWVVEEIRFTDDPFTVWDRAAMKVLALIGGAGNDTLTGFSGNDTISGGGGVDQLQGGLGDDTLDGGAGNDVLSGESHLAGVINGRGNDTYLFGRGDGQDTIYDVDATPGNQDRIVFKTGVLPSDVQIVRSGDHLLLKIIGTTDQVLVFNQFQNDAGTGWVVEEVRFADDPATVWDPATLKVLALIGGAGNDTLTGYAGDDTLAGNAGADVLHGRDGNDMISGGAGVDQLQGGLGDDTLDGGAGNDVMSGEAHVGVAISGRGNDTYLFGRGDGQDMIYDVDTTAGNLDRVIFGPGIAVKDVQFVQSASNLIMKIAGSTDQLHIANYFNAGNAWAIEQIGFSDNPAVVVGVSDLGGVLANGGYVVT